VERDLEIPASLFKQEDKGRETLYKGGGAFISLKRGLLGERGDTTEVKRGKNYGKKNVSQPMWGFFSREDLWIEKKKRNCSRKRHLNRTKG